MFSVGKNTMFVLIVVLASVCLTTTTVNAACTERPADNSTTDNSAVDKVSNFFVEVGCTLKSGAERVKERVESGYNYLKSKITPDDMKNQTMMADGPSTPSDDRITFKDDDNPDNMELGASLQITTPAGMFRREPLVVDRTALIAPEMCAEGEVRLHGKCRQRADV